MARYSLSLLSQFFHVPLSHQNVSFCNSQIQIRKLLVNNVFINFSRAYSYGAPKLTPQEVTEVLRANENIQDLQSSSVRAFETNQLPSNDPIEDRLSIAKCLLTTGLLFGVFDGHGGHLCSEVTSQRLMDYLATSFLPLKQLQSIATPNKDSSNTTLTEFFNEVEGLSPLQLHNHEQGLVNFAKQLLNKKGSNSDSFHMQESMTEAFEQYDLDLSEEVKSGIQNRLEEALSLAVMGCCACVAHVDGHHLHVASTGDCKAVLGVLSDDNVWTAVSLSKEHNTDNISEINRVLSEHPKSESNVVIKADRLLGCLAPLRAFGDFNFKWKTSLLQQLLVPFFGPNVVPSNYYTPPYLTAQPDIIHHKLTPKDKFLVIASDGLWEQLMPHKVVKLVGEHMSGKQVLDLLRLPQPNMSLRAINKILLQRKENLQKKPIDTNAATHLIRTALGWTESGIEHGKLSSMLALPKPIVRNFRDDITIVVIFFNSEFLRQTPG